MARGDQPVPIPVPTEGWVTAVPVYQMPPNSLRNDSFLPAEQRSVNVLIERDGLLKPRQGYVSLLSVNERIMGGISWTDNLTQFLVISTLTRWFSVASGAATDITDPLDLFSGSPDAPTRFAVFGFQDGASVLYGVNGTNNNLMHRWVAGSPVATVMRDPVRDFTLAAADIAVVVDRLVAVNTTEGGQTNPRRIRWSSVLDGQSWPALAFNDLEGDFGNIICIQPSSLTTAVVYCEQGAWKMTAVPGTDAGAFVFDRVQDVQAGPVSPTAIIAFGTTHYYLATDGHIWTCDGYNARQISDPIDAGLLAYLAVGNAQKPVVVYEETQQRLWFFCGFKEDVLGDSVEAFHAIPYRLLDQKWDVPQKFAAAVSAGFTLVEMFGPTWDNPGKDADGNDYTWDSAPWPSWDAIPDSEQPAVYIGMIDGRLCRFLGGSGSDDGTAIDFVSTWPLMTPGPRQRFTVNTIEVYIEQEENAEQPAISMIGVRSPYDKTQIPLLAATLLTQNDPATWFTRLRPFVPPQPEGSAFRPANYQQFTLKGSTTATLPHYAGGTAFAAVEERPDPMPGTIEYP